MNPSLRGRLRPALRLACAVLALVAAPVRADDWVLSILEGDAVVIDGARRVAAALGLAAHPAAIVETDAKLGLLRLESKDKVSVDLGPGTRVMLEPPALRATLGAPPGIYLLEGWVKVTSHGSARTPAIRTPGIDVGPVKGALVVHVQGDAHSVFAESGAAEVGARGRGAPVQALAEGRFYAGDGSKSGSVAPRPAPAWLAQAPRAFRDPIPLRTERALARRVEPEALPAPSYEELAGWLGAERDIRRHFPRRFLVLARDGAFRRELQSHLRAHPEWDPILNPAPPPPPPSSPTR